MNRGFFLLAGSALTALAMVYGPASRAQSSLPDLPSCELNLKPNMSSVLIMIDRTTRLDPVAKSRYDDGINHILNDQTIHGMVTVMEIRDTENEAPVVGAGCIDTTLDEPTPKGTAERHPAGIFDSLSSWLSQILGSSSPPAAEHDESRSDDNAAARAYAAAYLRNLLVQDDPTSVDTEITQTVVAAITAYCSHRQTCNLFLYSDLLDSDAKRAYKYHKNMLDYGHNLALQLLDEHRPSISGTNLNVVAWGFGRDDRKAGLPLQDPQRRAIKDFWTGFFSALEHRSGDNSKFVISDLFPE